MLHYQVKSFGIITQEVFNIITHFINVFKLCSCSKDFFSLFIHYFIYKNDKNKIHVNFITDSFEELQHQESYLEFAVDRLKGLMFSSNAGRTLAMGDVVRQTMDIWTEMPFKEFISNKRLFEGKPYQYYENRLKSFL